MSKRARITLNPETETESAKLEATVPAAEEAPGASTLKHGSAREPAAAVPRETARSEAGENKSSAGTVIKAVLVGLAVAAVVLLLKGRKA